MALLALGGCDTALRDELTEAQADEIVALLHQEGVASSKKRSENGTWSIEVDGEHAAGIEQLVYLYGLPRQRHPSVADIFPGTGLLPSEMEEHARYQFALGEQLAGTLEQIDGVLAARVNVAIPPRNPRTGEQPRSTASVFVRYRSDQRVDLMKSQIRDLVARALPKGIADDVSVLAVPVYPPVFAGAQRMVKSWLGVRYMAADAGRLAWWLALPWLLLVGLAVYLGWRFKVLDGLPRWRNRILGIRPMRRFGFGSKTRRAAPGSGKRP